MIANVFLVFDLDSNGSCSAWSRSFAFADPSMMRRSSHKLS